MFKLKNASQLTLTCLLLSVLFIIHLLIIQNIGLGVDEAHYAMYALNIDWSYFDHPPLVGWLLGLVKFIGFSDIKIRLVTMIIMSINSLLLFSLTRKIYPKGKYTAFLAVCLFNLSAVIQYLSFAIVPDVPLMTCLLLMALLLVEMKKNNHIFKWLMLGVLLGLGGLSKYTVIAMPMAMIIWLYFQGYLLSWLKDPLFWLAMLVAFLVTLPVFIWNASNNWISFYYQLHHSTYAPWHIKRMLVMVGISFFAYSPLLYIFSFGGVFAKFKRGMNKGESLIISIALVFLAMVLWTAGHGNKLLHWPAIGFLFLSPIAADFMISFYNKNKHRWLIYSNATSSSLIILFLYSVLLFKPTFLGVDKAYKDLIGWQEASIELIKLAKNNHVNTIWVPHWQYASRVAWYTRDSDLKVKVISNEVNQFAIWNGNAVKKDLSIFVLPKKDAEQLQVIDGNKCNKISSYEAKVNQKTVNYFSFYLCRASDGK